jgi:hypothetical protein
MMVRGWKVRILFLVIVTVMGFAFFKTGICVNARDNAYLACFVDDNSYMFKTQVVYSSQEVEKGRLSVLTNGDLDKLLSSSPNEKLKTEQDRANNTITGYDSDIKFVKEDNSKDRVQLMGNDGNFYYSNAFGGGGNIYRTTFELRKGFPSLSVYSGELTKNNSKFVEAADVPWSKIGEVEDKNNNYVLPLTFPANIDTTSRNSDVNRAYEVQSALSDDFKNALMFINDGKPYSSLNILFETAFYLVTSSDTEVTSITNTEGKTYCIQHVGVEADSPYLYKIKIWEKNGTKNNATYYTFKVKKGYLDCSYGDVTESGTSNTVATSTLKDKLKETDTTWISWEHLYLEAAILYAQGVTYSNQADLYSTDELETGIVKLTRSLLNGLNGIMMFYSIEDLMFNKGIRGGRAFVYGAYYENWSPYLLMIFLIFTGIAISGIMFLLVNVINKRQLAAVSPTIRVSLLSEIGRIVLCLMFLGSFWWIVKFALICNFKFTEIWSEFVGDRTLENVGGSYSVLATIVFQFAYFAINAYINFMYIMRSLFIALEIMLAPIFIFIGGLGPKASRITGAWAKSLAGFIFIQSIHSFVYGFVIMASSGLRGIESLVVCSSIIPLNSLISDLFGLDLRRAEKTAGAYTATGVAASGAAVSAGAMVAAKGAESIGSAVGTYVGGTYGNRVATKNMQDNMQRIEAQRQGEQTRLSNQYRNSSRTMTQQEYQSQMHGINAKYEQQRANAVDLSNRTRREYASRGENVGRSSGRIAGGILQSAGGLENAMTGIGYTLGTQERSYFASQGIEDMGRSMGSVMDGTGDIFTDAAYSKGRIVQNERSAYRQHKPPIMPNDTSTFPH